MSASTSFGEILKGRRTAKKLTQQQLADAAGMSQVAIARLEKGRRSPSWETVQRLAAALGVDCTAFQVQASPAPAKPAKKKPKK